MIHQFTVVIPTFNRSLLVQRAVESVLKQSYAAAQIILVDDGSVDGTAEACKRFSNSIEYLYQANAGVSSARNRGIMTARQPWTAFLDSDDYWKPDHLEKIAAAIEATEGKAVLYFADMQVPGETTLWSKIGFHFPGAFLLKEDAVDWMLAGRQPCPIACSVFNTASLQASGGFDLRYRVKEDTELFCRLGIGSPACAVKNLGGVETADEKPGLRLTGMVHHYSIGYWEHDQMLWMDVMRHPRLSPSREKWLRCYLANAHWRLFRLKMASGWSLSHFKHLAAGIRTSPIFLFQANLSRVTRRPFAPFVSSYRGGIDTGIVESPKDQKSYGQILKSSALIGGSSALNVGFRILRAKVMALILGPSGIGLIGLYGSISDLTRTVAGLGIKDSGVRQIAEATGADDPDRVARIVTTLRRTAFYCGALGVLLLLVFAKSLSSLTFGDDTHAGAIALLAFGVFLSIVSDGQGAILQGLRRIADLARMNVIGAFFGTLLSVLVVYLYNTYGVAKDGVVPSLVCVAIMAVITSWWYTRGIELARVTLSSAQMMKETAALLKMGSVHVTAGLLIIGSGYAARVIVLHLTDLESAGFYHSAWAIGGIYIGFILDAMGADFYPRLTSLAKNDRECNRLVNEQTEVGLLMAAPGMIATLTFAPLIMEVFYSDKFASAVDILRWISLGMILRVISWPMGFMLLAKGERRLFTITEAIKNSLFVGLIWPCVKLWGLPGAGIAFFSMYAVYSIGMYIVVKRLSGYAWSAANRRLITAFVPLVTLVFVDGYFLPHWADLLVDSICILLTCLYSLKELSILVPTAQRPKLIQQIEGMFRPQD